MTSKFLCIIPVLLLIMYSFSFAQVTDSIWVRRYNGPANGNDLAWAITTDTSGNIYVTGYSHGNTSRDYATLKYYPNGDTTWVSRYNGPGDSADWANMIAVDDSGYVYVTGESVGSGTDFDFATIKYYPNGDTVWVRRYNGSADTSDKATDMALDDFGNVYVTGYAHGSGTHMDYTTIRYLPNGDTAWVRKYNGPPGFAADAASALALDASGNIYVTGRSYGTGTYYDFATIKYYTDGDTAWVRRYNGTADSTDGANDIAIDGFGNVYVTGRASNSGTDYDYTTIKYDSSGNALWVRTYNGTADTIDIAEYIAVDNSGNVYVSGRTYNTGSSYDFTTIKYLPNGDTAWVRIYNGSGNSNDYVEDLVIDEFNNIYVTGYTYSSGTAFDYTTIKYYPNGDTGWLRMYNGVGNNLDYATAMIVDDFKNVYVTGWSDVTGGMDWDYVTIKYGIQRGDTLIYTAYSPVDLIVTDPNLDSIGVDFNTIPEATYDTTQDINEDGENDDVVTIPKPLIGEYTVRVVAEPGSEGGSYTLSVKLDGNEDTPIVNNVSAPGPSEVDTFYYPVFEYLRGDANSDGATSISDVIYTINYLFKGGDPPNPSLLGDANCCKEGDGNCDVVEISVSDVIYLINYLFKGGTAPCS